jgi:hypothetical protein
VGQTGSERHGGRRRNDPERIARFVFPTVRAGPAYVRRGFDPTMLTHRHEARRAGKHCALPFEARSAADVFTSQGRWRMAYVVAKAYVQPYRLTRRRVTWRAGKHCPLRSGQRFSVVGRD